MTGLPRDKERVRIYPMPGRKVQNGPRPVDHFGGGHFLPKGGAIVEWSTEYENQLRAGDILLHPPPCEDHDHGKGGSQECAHCGRTPEQAKKYDAERADGIKAAEAARASLPQHPHELELHPQSEDLAGLRKAEDEAAKKRAVESKAPVIPPDPRGPLTTLPQIADCEQWPQRPSSDPSADKK